MKAFALSLALSVAALPALAAGPVVAVEDPAPVVVPEAAVQASQKGPAVWVVKPDGTAEMRPVTVTRTVEGRSVIGSGIAAGETVVTDGQLRLAPGIKVEAKRAQAAGADKAGAGA